MTHSEETLATEALRSAADQIARQPRAEMRIVAKVIGEVLLQHGESRGAEVSTKAIDARCAEFGASDSTGEVESVRPIEVLRRGPRSDQERAVISVLLAKFLGEMLDGESGPTKLKAKLSAVDWLEFTGPYAPYQASDLALGPDTGDRFAQLLRDTPVQNWSLRAMAAVRALRGIDDSDGDEGSLSVRARRKFGPSVSIAGELIGASRGFWTRILSIFSGLAVVRALVVTLGRGVFSYRRPTTISVDGDQLRMVGHSEVLGRTLKTWDWKVAIASVRELKKEARFPWAPAALSMLGLTLGTLFGARKVIEGAGAKYFPLVGIGLGLIALGIGFELVLRAIWPGITGKMRLTLRTDDGRAMEFSQLDSEELERLLQVLEGGSGNGASKASGKRALGAPSAASASSSLNGEVSSAERSHWGLDTEGSKERDDKTLEDPQGKTVQDANAYAAVVQERDAESSVDPSGDTQSADNAAKQAVESRGSKKKK